MKETPLELVTLDNIRLDDFYYENLTGTGNYRDFYSGTLIPAFSEPRKFSSSLYEPTVGMPKFPKELTYKGATLKVDILNNLEYSFKTLSELREKYPQLAKELEKRIPKNYFKKRNAEALAEREENKASIQKQYNELLELFTELGSKADLSTMADIDTLLYCEAKGFMMKIEERIAKKNNPKNLKLYNRLQEIRGKETISCKD